MRIRTRWIFEGFGAAVALLLIVGIAAPYLNADRYGQRLRWSLERALGRRVEFRGKVRFSLFSGPGFSVENVVIHEDPAIGVEPAAYMDAMEVRPGIWSLLGGRFVISSIRLDGASINLTKSGPASEWGRWNFASLANRSLLSAVPAIHVRQGRINFKFGDTKSIFYLTETDLDISPPGANGAAWSLVCSAKPARTDRMSQGLGAFTLKGRWFRAPERVDLDLQVDRARLDVLTALLRGQTGSVHGTLSTHLHLGGPIENIGIEGRVDVEDVHRWDLLPPTGQGWPLDVRGHLDLVSQQIELQSNSPGNAPLPLWVRFRANDYLSQPRWAATVNWNHFPVGPLMELARHMGAQFPPKLELSGSMDGAIGYSGEGSLQGELALHDAALTIPDSPSVRFEEAHIVLDRDHVHLTPALVRTAADDEAQIEADYSAAEQTLQLSIHTEAMKVESLRAQVALAAVPWLEEARAGEWSGDLRYQYAAASQGWTGRLKLKNVQIPVPGLLHPLQLASARAEIDGARVVLSQMDARTGKLAFTGEYRYEPNAARPHRLRIHAETLDASRLEDELMPTLRRSGSLLARALGRSPLPDWLKQRGVEGTVQIDDVLLAGSHLENFRTHLLWDAARADFDSLQARLDHAAVTGKLAINLRGSQPVYKFTGKVKGLAWQSGKVDAEGEVSTSGIGAQLMEHLASEGTFTSAGLDFETPDSPQSMAGAYSLTWPQAFPRWRLTNLVMRTEDDTYTGHGATQDDGRLAIVFTSGAKEVRMSGPLAKLKIEEPARP